LTHFSNKSSKASTELPTSGSDILERKSEINSKVYKLMAVVVL